MRDVLISLTWHAALLVQAYWVVAAVAARWTRDRVVLLAAATAGTGLVYYAMGIVWWGSADLGIWVSRAWPVAGAAVLVHAGLRRRAEFLVGLRAVVVPLGLSVLYAGSVLALGFLRGGSQTSTDTAATRFTWKLPMDNVLPFLFARHVESAGSVPPPPVGDWLSSDRPPLQTAFSLGMTVVHRDDAHALLDYQVLGTLLQSLWIVGAWVLLGVLAVRRKTSALAIGACAGSAVIVMNTFFVWPKLLAACFALAALAMVLRRPGRRAPVQFMLAAVLAALGYLSHGGVVFVLVPVAVVGLVLAWRQPRRWSSIGAAVAAGVVLVAPWTAYQRLIDPPGDRLLKWMLADVVQVDSRSPVRAILDQYEEAGFSGAVDNKIENVARLFGGAPWHVFDPGLALNDGSLQFLRQQAFYALVPSLGLLLVLGLGLVFARRDGTTDRRAAVVLLSLGLASTAFWCLVMFGPGTTYLHQGTYAIVLLLALGLVCAGCAWSRRLTVVVVTLATAASFVILLPQRQAENSPIPPGGSVSLAAVFVLVVGLGLFGGLLWSWARRESLEIEDAVRADRLNREKELLDDH